MSESNIINTVVTPESSQAAPEGLLTDVSNVPAAPAPSAEEAAKASSNLMDLTPKEYKAFVEKKGFKDMGSVFKSLENLESKLGKRFEDMTPEDIKLVNNKLGVPEKGEDYGLKMSDEMRKDPILADVEKDLLAAGIPKGHAEKLLESISKKYHDEISKSITEDKLRTEGEIEAIKKEFGTAFQERVGLANMALNRFGGEGAIKAIQEAGLSSNPAIVKMLVEVGKLISEDTSKKDSSVSTFGITPDEAAEELAELHADKEFLRRLRTPSDPGHREAIARRERLYKLKAGIR